MYSRFLAEVYYTAVCKFADSYNSYRTVFSSFDTVLKMYLGGRSLIKDVD